MSTGDYFPEKPAQYNPQKNLPSITHRLTSPNGYSGLKPAVVFPPVTVTLKITPDAFILGLEGNKKTKNPYI
jgi:hypothetical protein